MNLSSRMILVLTSVGLISGGFLAGVANLTGERIAINKQKEIEEAITRIVPRARQNLMVYTEEDLVVYLGKNDQGAPAGYAVKATGIGFQDKITLMFGMDTEMTRILGLTILEQRETPGLGAKITDQDAFLRFWENRDIAAPLVLRKPPAGTPEELAAGEVNAITGATISSEKVLDIVNLSLEKLKALYEQGRLTVEEEDVE